MHSHKSRSLIALVVFTLAVSMTAVSGASQAVAAEPGEWVDILPDASLKGWTRIPIPAVAGLKPEIQWSVDSAAKTLTCSGTGGHEWLRFDEELGDIVLSVEWKATEREGKYNSGIGVRLSKMGEIWHQAQTGPTGGYLFGSSFVDGGLKSANLRKQMTENRLKPAGEWNSYEIRCEGDTITLSVNGAVVSTWENNQMRRGYIGLEAEGYEMVFRNIKLKKLN